MNAAGLARAPRGQRWGFGHRLSGVHPIPVTLRRHDYAMGLEELSQSDVGQPDRRSEVAHRRRPGEVLQILRKNEEMIGEVTVTHCPDLVVVRTLTSSQQRAAVTP